MLRKKFNRSYGRTKARKLGIKDASLIKELLPNLSIPNNFSGDCSKLFFNDNEVWFEIGFGTGDNIVSLAKNYPNINFIGCEPFLNGIAATLKSIEANNLKNIRIWQNDARLFLEKIPDNSFKKIFILFPDPWPKKKHHKRRLINKKFLEHLSKKLGKGGILRIATDHDDYCNWILASLVKLKNLEWPSLNTNSWHITPPDWCETKYQKRATKEGKNSTYIELTKI